MGKRYTKVGVYDFIWGKYYIIYMDFHQFVLVDLLIMLLI